MSEMTKSISPKRKFQLWNLSSRKLVNAVRKLGITFIYLLLIGVIVGNVVWAFRENSSLLDFGSFIASGRAVRYGLPPYEPHYPSIFHLNFDWQGIVIASVNLNPPISLPFASLLAGFNPYNALPVWRFGSILLYFVCIIILQKTFPIRRTILFFLWLISLAGLWHTIELGQVYIPLLLFEVLAFWFFKTKRDEMAGLCIGAVAVLKPNFLIWPVLLLLSRRWRIAIPALVGFATLSMVPLFIYGPEVYAQWLTASSKYHGYALATNNSLIGLAARFDLPTLGVGLGALVLLTTAVLIVIRSPEPITVSTIAIVLSLLTSPIAWSGYTLFTLPMFFRRKWSVLDYAAAVILAVPVVLILTEWDFDNLWFILFGWWYGWALLLILASELIPLFRPKSMTENVITIEHDSHKPDFEPLE